MLQSLLCSQHVFYKWFSFEWYFYFYWYVIIFIGWVCVHWVGFTLSGIAQMKWAIQKNIIMLLVSSDMIFTMDPLSNPWVVALLLWLVEEVPLLSLSSSASASSSGSSLLFTAVLLSLLHAPFASEQVALWSSVPTLGVLLVGDRVKDFL